MVTVFQEPGLFGPGFQQGIGALAQGLQDQQGRSRQAQGGSTLMNLLQELPEDASQLDYLQLMAKAQASGVPQNLQGVLGTAMQLNSNKKLGPDEVRGSLEKAGIEPSKADKIAHLMGISSTGGQTEILKHIVDQASRGNIDLFGQSPVDEQQVQDADIEEQGYQYPDIDNFQGLTSKERVSTQSEYRKINKDLVTENQKQIKGAETQKRSVEQLDRLNKTGKLPKSFGRLNLNPKTGDLFLPAASNAETQLFVKTVNDFTVKAKDSFGARVTNFELDRFMQRLPTLANTAEGRDLIINQMQSINAIDELHATTLRDVYRKYGISNIDPVQAEEIAEQKEKAELESLLGNFESIVPQAPETQEGEVTMMFQGRRIAVPQDQVQQALQAGATQS